MTGESSKSFIRQLLVNLTEFLQFLVESEVVDGSISSDVGCEEERDVELDSVDTEQAVLR